MAPVGVLVALAHIALCMAQQKDGGKAYRLYMNDEKAIPTMGLGTFLGFDEKGQKNPKPNEVSHAVESAIDNGYRLIDTAPLYLDEDQVGLGIDNKIKDGTVKREDLFIVTKLPSSHHGRERVQIALKESLKSLRLDYVDLYLVHWPMGFTNDNKPDGTDLLDTWRGMEDAQRSGLAKSIGISNFNISQIQRVLDNAQIKPTVNQVEVNLNFHQGALVDYCKSKLIQVMAYAPFGSMFSSEGPAPKKDDPTLVGIAQKYGKTTPQIAIRYLVQRGLIPIPKSTNQERIKQNIDVFNFKLSSEDMKTLDTFNKDYRTVSPSFWQSHPEYPFEKVANPIESPF